MAAAAIMDFRNCALQNFQYLRTLTIAILFFLQNFDFMPSTVSNMISSQWRPPPC